MRPGPGQPAPPSPPHTEAGLGSRGKGRGRPAEVCGRAFQVEGTGETQPSILEVTMNMWWFITKLYKTTNFRAEVRF